MSIKQFAHNVLVNKGVSSYQTHRVSEDTNGFDGEASLGAFADVGDDAPDYETPPTASVPRCVVPMAGLRLCPAWKGMSSWSCSAGKRLFDCTSVLLALPLLIPMMLAIAMAVRLTSRGPVLFLQQRMGRCGCTFTIFKFRTMVHILDGEHHPVTTEENQQFTPIGPFLRRWKLDELPQLVNVLLGDMSLVGPRPKLPQHEAFDLPCRPGITGMATSVFACEEKVLASVPNDELNAFYHSVLLPAKRQLDAEYMARATFVSDMRLLVRSVLRRWDYAKLEEVFTSAALERDLEMVSSQTAEPLRHIHRKFTLPSVKRPSGSEQNSAFTSDQPLINLTPS